MSPLWASSDVLVTVRTDLKPEKRALEPDESPALWFVPEDYPQRRAKALQDATLRQW